MDRGQFNGYRYIFLFPPAPLKRELPKGQNGEKKKNEYEHD